EPAQAVAGVTPTLRVADLAHRYDRPALDGVSFDVEAGEVVAVVGPSGAGKSTLFRAICGLVEPERGRVEIAGEQRGAGVALVFQQHNLVRRLSALDNVVAGRLARLPLWRALLGRPGPSERKRALDLLHHVGIGELACARADRLSGGQQQRVAIARALAQGPRVLLADEPVASLDPASTALVLDALRQAAMSGVAVVCSLHQVELVAGFADRVIGLRNGKIVLDQPAGGLDEAARALLYGSSPSQAGTGPMTPQVETGSRA
ncbi:MAG: ATP-binding cassette domain-containing protein, partial [Acidimicrobiales bacterium]|nr:ATP-binding cassette domain-containing protein [Acidimicrobiales bacterium]